MRSFLAVSSAILLSVAITAQGPRGVVTSVSATLTPETGKYQFVVRGNNPCGAVFIELGDGSEGITHAIEALPFTVLREYTRVGRFRATAKGMGNCDGTATTDVTVTAVRPQPPPPPPQPATPPAPAIRFAEMDSNGDGVITRTEWRGSPRSFAFHDWNSDNRLSGDEVRLGAAWPSRAASRFSTTVNDWSETRFRQIDRNGDGRINRGEWRYDVEDFLRTDRNGDNQLTLNEFLIGDVDDDRGDRFDDLDLNRDNRLDRNEWHGSIAAFRWLDRNEDGVLTRVEAVGAIDTGGGIRGAVGNREKPRVVMVSATREWTDTGIALEAGDVIDISASGRIFFAPGQGDIAPASGATGRPATRAAPMSDVDIGALVGRIGDGRVFFVGETLAGYRVQSPGRLLLRVNDDILTDNRGEFRALITVTAR